jgi:hypothetical protein
MRGGASHYVAQFGLKLVILCTLPESQKLQVCTTTPSLKSKLYHGL